MRRTIRLTESDLHRIITNSIRTILSEGVGRDKGIHEKPHISVKPGLKYTGRDPKGMNYLVYVDGARMFNAKLHSSEHDSWNGGAYMNRGTYSEITIYYGRTFSPGPIDKFDSENEFRKSIGFESDYDLNTRQATENVLSVIPYADISVNDKFMTIRRLGELTPENAPYIIQKCVEGLLTPQNNRTKETDEVTFYDVNDETEKTMSVKDAYQYAIKAYKKICDYEYDDKIRKPDQYSNIEDCLEDYYHALRAIKDEEFDVPMSWEEKNERGYFDVL